MSTLDEKVNIYLKKFLTQQQITTNFLDYLLKQTRESFSKVWQSNGVFEPSIVSNQLLSSDTVDTFDIITPLVGTDGPLGNVLNLDSIDSNNITFENENGVEYFVGLRFQEIPSGTEINARTGKVEYTFLQERIGELSEPDSVVDDGDETLTIEVDGIFEPGVSNAGRKVLVYLKQAVSQADTFEEATVIFSGGKNVIETITSLGQTLGSISVDPADYQVFAIGSTVRRNTDLRLDPNVLYIGKFDGAGAGSSPTNFNQDDVTNLAFGMAGIINLFDVEHSTIDGTHTDINPDTITTKPAVQGIQLDTQVNAGDEDTPDAPVIHTLFSSVGGSGLQDAKWVVRDSGGQVIAFVDAHGNAYFQSLAAVDSIFKSNLVVEGNTTLGNDIGADITTFNSIQQSLTDMIYVIDSNDDGANSYKFYKHAVSALNLLMELNEDGDLTLLRDVIAGRQLKAANDVLSGGATEYSKNSDLTPIPTVASLNEVYDETLNRKLLKVNPNNPGDKIVLIAASFITLADGSLYALSNGPLVTSFAGGNINFQTGVNSDGDNFTPIDFTGQNDKWFKFSLNLLQNNEILILSNDPNDGGNFGTTQANTPPPPISVEAISFAVIAIQNNSAVSVTEIHNLIESNFTRLPVGGGGGGSGDASTLLGRMEDFADETFFMFLEPNIISQDELDKVDSTDGTLNVVDKTIDLDAGEFVNSIELLDPEFLEGITDLLAAHVVLVFELGFADTAPIVTLTNNGADFQAVTMNKHTEDTFEGRHVFDLSLLVLQTLDEYAVGEADGTVELNTTTQQQIGQEFVTSTDTNIAEQIEVYVEKTGTPTGFLQINFHEDNASEPGAILSQILKNVEDLAAGNNVVTVEIGRHVLQPSQKYHISIGTDQGYKDSFTTTVDAVDVRVDNSAPSIPDRQEFDGTVWAAVAGSAMVYKLEGRKLSLKMTYTAGTASKLLGYGVYYGEEQTFIQRIKRRNQFVFNGSSVAGKAFYNAGLQLTFDATPAFFELHDVFANQVMIVPGIALENNLVRFPFEDFFDGRDEVVLIAKQVEAGSFDGNPENTKLLQENFLGSGDPGLDNSVPGRGPSVRAAVVTTRVEITVDEFFNIVIKEA